MRSQKTKLSKKHLTSQNNLNKNKNTNIISDINEPLELIKFSEGHLKNISLYLTNRYYSNVFSQGEYDKQVFDDFQKITNHKEIILDVGGFMGVSSLLFSKIAGSNSKIISFEPNPYNLNRMLLNFSKNQQLSRNISIISAALGDKVEKTDFLLSTNIDNGYSSTSRLLNTHVEHSQEQLREMGFFKQKIDQNTLDNFINVTKILPSVIKVDIEGAEHLFLLGAQNYLKDHSPILYIELHSQYCALKCTEIMDNLGYENTILFEESDNRILVKYYKDNTKKNKNGTTINRLEQKIIKDQINSLITKMSNLKDQNNKLRDEIININSQNSKLTNDITNLNGQNSKLRDEKKEINKKFSELEKYLIKLINNPIIKAEIKIFRLLKKVI